MSFLNKLRCLLSAHIGTEHKYVKVVEPKFKYLSGFAEPPVGALVVEYYVTYYHVHRCVKCKRWHYSIPATARVRQRTEKLPLDSKRFYKLPDSIRNELASHAYDQRWLKANFWNADYNRLRVFD